MNELTERRNELRDLTDQKFGRLTAIRHVGVNKYRNCLWLCKCDCGQFHTVAEGKLVQGKSRSCGCLKKENGIKQLEKHGITTGGKPRTFIIWNGMKARCYNPKSVSYKNYGAKGIKICDEWMSFENFHRWAVNNGYADNSQIDRIDNSQGYCPENCRWVTVTENMRNQSKTRNITVYGITLPISVWCKELHAGKGTAYKHLNTIEEWIKSRIDSGKGQQYFINKFLGE